MSALADLQAEYRQLRAEDAETGMRRLATANAYERWFSQACADGEPPDQLRRYIADEVERFFARTIQGPDGHVYWDCSLDKGFRLNDGSRRKPTRWWWDRVHGPSGRGRLDPTCSEKRCINPEHLVFVSWAEIRAQYSVDELIGRLQVEALRLGHTPRRDEWDLLGLKPSASAFAKRFNGSWHDAVRAAGLPIAPLPHAVNADMCIAALRLVASLLGHKPTQDEFIAQAPALHDAHLPSSHHTIRTHLGLWADALRKAGVT